MKGQNHSALIQSPFRFDLAHSARKQAPPTLPCQWKLKALRDPAIWKPDDYAYEFLKVAGTGFDNDVVALPTHSSVSFSHILGAIAEISVAFDHVQRTDMTVLQKPLSLLDNAKWACHNLLSIPTLSNTGGPSDGNSDHTGDNRRASHLLSEVCRLAGCVFVDFAVFPTRSHQSGARRSQSSKILEVLGLLHKETSPRVWDEHFAFVRWAAMMGAMSSDNKQAYHNFLAECCIREEEEEEEWEAVETSLKRFLWLPHNFREPCRHIWVAAKGSRKAVGPGEGSDAQPNS